LSKKRIVCGVQRTVDVKATGATKQGPPSPRKGKKQWRPRVEYEKSEPARSRGTRYPHRTWQQREKRRKTCTQAQKFIGAEREKKKKDSRGRALNDPDPETPRGAAAKKLLHVGLQDRNRQ